MDLSNRDRRVIWHPYTQHQTAFLPMEVKKANGVWLELSNGLKIFDAISSWWVNLHGHAHPYIAEKIANQALSLEQVIFADFTHEGAVVLAERVLKYLPGFSKVFYSDNGSTAVEVALKMAVQFFANEEKEQKHFIAFKNSYHGDTFGAMAVGERGNFTGPFENMLFSVSFVDPSSQTCLEQFSRILETKKDIAGFIFEPLVQGAGGMKMHSPHLLDCLIKLCQEHDIITIADEVMTGFYRTGKFFAIDYLQTRPDIICLSKGLTGGVMPLSMTICNEEIYQNFLGKQDKTFFHGHSFTANSLGCAAALASLDLLEKASCQENIAAIHTAHQNFKKRIILHHSDKIRDIRLLGTIMAIELETFGKSGYFNKMREEIYDFFLEKNILLRPLGNVLYMIPPYCVKQVELDLAYDAIDDFLKRFHFKKRNYGIS